MATFLSTPIHKAHTQAKRLGLDPLSKSQLLEVAASLFGYETYRVLADRADSLRETLARNDVGVFLDEYAAKHRTVSLLHANGLPTTSARRYVELMVDCIRQSITAPVFMNEGSFFDEHLDPYLEPFFLEQLSENDEMLAVHAKVNVLCEFVECIETYSITDIWKSREKWLVDCMVEILPRGKDGKPYGGGEYLLSQAQVAYAKIDRAVVSVRPDFAPANAQAKRFHAGMGGEHIR
ncbi:hypothetical protein NP554_21835 [Pseudomonas asiatica]|uniref:Uncharacterized protein n=1 Tax=Pseudomonas asiatica TaxID=2219225 RepID=A0A9X4HTN1_9PSED|nr:MULTISPECIES: hypothetical protein [Pseudomonas]MDD2108741.1 hypothetical protein [Pseudomonas asiatica]MDD2114427.1 hypothetical protein [Pseudomonas asiatica]OUS78844.1 hypothetical protein CBP05_28440 [Pseudomonas putida]OUS87482.1 hypothetical protein CBP06_15110 [Pseudomonas putida]